MPRPRRSSEPQRTVLGRSAPRAVCAQISCVGDLEAHCLGRASVPARGKPVRQPSGPTAGSAVYFERCVGLVLGLDVGARFVRGAICDLAGTIRARQDVELPVAVVPEAVSAIERLRTSLYAVSGLDPNRVDGVVVGVPGVVEGESGLLRLAENVEGLEGRAFADELQSALDLPVTLENDVNLAALGEQWHGVARGVGDFVFLSIGTGMGAGLVLGGELLRGRHGAAGEIDFALVGVDESLDPSRSKSPSSLQIRRDRGDARAIRRGPNGDEGARAVVQRSRDGSAPPRARRRGGRRAGCPRRRIGANGDLLPAGQQHLTGVARSCRGLDPRAAVLTGALAVGLRRPRERLREAACSRPNRFPTALARICARAGCAARPPVESTLPASAPARPQGHVLEPWLRMAVLHTQALDQLRSRLRRLRKLLAHALAEGRRERVELPYGWLSIASHVPMRPQKAARVCDVSVTKV